MEASYLVNAQEEQLAQMEENLILLERFDPPSYQITDAIGPGALVEVEHKKQLRFYLLAPSGGGMTTDFLGCELTIITPDSQLYQALLERKLSDQVPELSLTVMGVE